MADFIVLEEDGTSHLELEESTDDLVTEESGGPTSSTKAGFGVVGTVGSGVGPPTPPPSNATWKVGTITVPSSTGSMAITGLGGTPAAVFFWGTNFLTEDTAVTTAHLGLFRGMAAPNYASPGSILNSAASVIPAGDAHHSAASPTNPYCMNMLDTTGNLSFLYVSGVTSFDTDGFTLNWVTAASGGYKVVYAALMDVQNVGGFIGSYNNTITLGWKAGASMLHGSFNGPDVGDNNATQEFYGSAAYPGTSSSGWKGAGISAFWRTELGGQGRIDIEANDPTIIITQGAHFTGAFLTPSNIQVYPSSSTQLAVTGDASDGGMVVAWDDEDSMTGFMTTPDNATDTTTLTGLPFAPGMVTGYTISDEPTGGTTFLHGAVGFSVVTPDFQWCAIVDGVSSQGAYQSFSKGWADNVSGTSVHAGTMDLTSDGFILTTVEDSLPIGQWVYHAFGHPEQFPVWIPQSYRRRN